MICRFEGPAFPWMPDAVAAGAAIGIEVRPTPDSPPVLEEPTGGPVCIVTSLPATVDELSEWFGRRERGPAPTAVVFVTEGPRLRPALEAIRRGAIDVLEWPAENGRWEAVLQRARCVVHEWAERRAAEADCGRILEGLRVGDRHVLELMLAGKANKKIAAELTIALRTVEARRRRIFQAFRTRSLVSIAETLRRKPSAAESGPPRPWFLERSQPSAIRFRS